MIVSHIKKTVRQHQDTPDKIPQNKKCCNTSWNMFCFTLKGIMHALFKFFAVDNPRIKIEKDSSLCRKTADEETQDDVESLVGVCNKLDF